MQSIEDLCEKFSTLLHLGKENRKTRAKTLHFESALAHPGRTPTVAAARFVCVYKRIKGILKAIIKGILKGIRTAILKAILKRILKAILKAILKGILKAILKGILKGILQAILKRRLKRFTSQKSLGVESIEDLCEKFSTQ